MIIGRRNGSGFHFVFFSYSKRKEFFMDRIKKLIGYDEHIKLTGEGIGVAIIDSGVSPHKDLEHRIIAFKDEVHQKEYLYDDNGHGTHIAGILSGSGEMSAGRYQGIAPKSDLIIIKVLGKQGEGMLEHMLRALYWILEHHITYHIRIVNISIGMMVEEKSYQYYQLLGLIERIWNKGIVIICASGNNGPQEGSVTLPGSLANVITVGTAEQYDRNSLVQKFSGRGPTKECIVKPEVLAPGTEIWSCSHLGGYCKKTGTSMSVPVVSGAVALLLELKPFLTPLEVKIKLFQSTIPLHQKNSGWGFLYLPWLLNEE